MIDLDQKIINFLDNFFKAKYDIAKASEDASFRKYYRAFLKIKHMSLWLLRQIKSQLINLFF